ncbi:hypothetical protein Lser_V15G29818 [Lactuca serriola]
MVGKPKNIPLYHQKGNINSIGNTDGWKNPKRNLKRTPRRSLKRNPRRNPKGNLRRKPKADLPSQWWTRKKRKPKEVSRRNPAKMNMVIQTQSPKSSTHLIRLGCPLIGWAPLVLHPLGYRPLEVEQIAGTTTPVRYVTRVL